MGRVRAFGAGTSLSVDPSPISLNALVRKVEETKKAIERASRALVAERYNEAPGILEPLVEAEVPEAIGMLGTAYQLGLGVAIDGPKAVEILSKAAELGDGAAAPKIGTIYAAGMPGVAADPKLSKEFYRLAKERGAQCGEDSWYE